MSFIGATATKVPLRFDGIRCGAVKECAILAQPRHFDRQEIVEVLVGGEERTASPGAPVKRSFAGGDSREPVRYFSQGLVPGAASDERVDAIKPGIHRFREQLTSALGPLQRGRPVCLVNGDVPHEDNGLGVAGIDREHGLQHGPGVGEVVDVVELLCELGSMIVLDVRRP